MSIVKTVGLASALAIGLGLAVVPTAKADTVSIGLQQAGVNGGAITNEGSGTGFVSIGGVVYGSFTVNNVSGTAASELGPGGVLDSNSLNTTASTSGTLTVYVTASDLTAATTGFLSSFTSNALPAGWTVVEKTFLDTSNGVFAVTTPLSSATFTDLGTNVLSALASSGSLYSVTEQYIITATSVSSANSTIDVSSVVLPLPAALPLFASGMLGLWALGRRRKKQNPEPAIA